MFRKMGDYVKTGGEARRISFVSLVFFMCIAGLGLIGGGIGFVFVHPDQWSVSSALVTLGVGLFPVAYIFKGAAPKDAEQDPKDPKDPIKTTSEPSPGGAVPVKSSVKKQVKTPIKTPIKTPVKKPANTPVVITDSKSTEPTDLEHTVITIPSNTPDPESPKSSGSNTDGQPSEVVDDGELEDGSEN
jgi:hypothetical protein